MFIGPTLKKVVRFVCISDTHNNHHSLNIPKGDILIHAGDFTNTGTVAEVKNFSKWFKSLPHKYKIVICGNHEKNFDSRYCNNVNYFKSLLGSPKNNCFYLQDTGVNIQGIQIFGSPWSIRHGYPGAFVLENSEQCAEKWGNIPYNVDILITHQPAAFHGDYAKCGKQHSHVGCPKLLERIEKVIPKYHIFGHIHEGYGRTQSTKGTMFMNVASTAGGNRLKLNEPMVFDFLLPQNK